MSKEFIKTSKCSAFQHPEFVIEFDSTIPEADIAVLTSFLEESVERGTRYNDGELITFGSMLFRVTRGNNWLTVEEPDLQSWPIVWRPGISRSIQLMRLQRDIAESVGLENEIDPPSIRSSLLVGADLTPQDEEFVLERMNSSDSDSGWFIGRWDTVLDYDDEASLKRISVYQAILNWPRISGYLGLPAGCRVETTRTKLHVSRNDSTLEIKPGSLIDIFATTSRLNESQ